MKIAEAWSVGPEITRSRADTRCDAPDSGSSADSIYQLSSHDERADITRYKPASDLVEVLHTWPSAPLSLFRRGFGVGASQRPLSNGPRSSVPERIFDPIFIQSSLLA